MRKNLLPVVSVALLCLSACGGKGDDRLGDNAADAAEARADDLEVMADNASDRRAEQLEERADAVEERGEAAEEAIDESDVNADRLSEAQKNALINGQ